MATIEPTTAADVAEYFPRGISWRIRGFTVRDGGRIVGIGGIAYLPDEDGTVAAFVECAEADARRYRVALMKAARRTMAMADAMGIARLVAKVDDSREAAPRFLERLGFYFAGITDNSRIYLRVK